MILEYYQTIIGELYHLESYLSIQTEVSANETVIIKKSPKLLADMRGTIKN